MTKNEKLEFIFRQVDGIYIDTTNQFRGTLADFFTAWNIVIDDCTTFCRIRQDKYEIVYRAYGGAISVNIYHLNS